MFYIGTLEDLQARLKAENLPFTLGTLLKLEKEGVLAPPAGTRKIRLYSQGEIEYIVRVLRDYYSKQRFNKYKQTKMEDTKEPPNS